MENIDNILTKQIDNQIKSLEAEPLNHIWQMKRLKSLQNWTMAKPSAKEMAEAGFYCPNPDIPDTVRCFSCFIELDGWEPTDKPWEEHKKRALSLNPPCRFIEIGKKESDFIVDDFLEIQKSVILRIFNEKCDKLTKTALSLHKKKKSALKKDLQKKGMS
ncbi:PREDICTED: baculoviral IAP repeat-containing protein 5-like [Diuraphis noxia]|uniref:baculoviral IAP repeat-containing protein 5-like n=1 Tax=Diuraphis noxia TaxID=143948 RepID=UPI0007637BB2|nr:PREDICTED: baculoviral IAP repeat-containing protein 5-like [Diuraphis noxia]